MRFEKRVWAGIVSLISNICATVMFTKRAGQRGMIVSCADSNWHVQLEVGLRGTLGKKDIVNHISDEMAVVPVELLTSMTKSMPTERVNVYIEHNILRMKTRKSSARVTYEEHKSTARENADTMTHDQLREMITSGTVAIKATGPVTARILHEHMVPLCIIQVSKKELFTSITGAGVNDLVEIEVRSVSKDGHSRGQLRVVMNGSHTIIEEAQFEMGGNVHIRSLYNARYLRVLLTVSSLRCSLRLILYKPIIRDERQGPQLLGLEYRDIDGVFDALLLMSSGAISARVAMPSNRRVVKRLMNDILDNEKHAADIERDNRRRLEIEAQRRADDVD